MKRCVERYLCALISLVFIMSLLCIPVNAAPTVSIVKPVNNMSVYEGYDIYVLCSATGATKVEIYNGETLLGEAFIDGTIKLDTGEYGYLWKAPAAGDYVLTAKAYSGVETATSSPINVSVASVRKVTVADVNFDDYTATELSPALPLGWTVSNANAGYTQFSVASPNNNDATVKNGRSLKFQITAGSVAVPYSATRYVTPISFTGKVSYEMNFYTGDTTSVRSLIRVGATNTGANMWALLNLTRNGNISAYLTGNNGGAETILCPYSINRWYNIKMVIDTDNMWLDILVDNVKYISQYNFKTVNDTWASTGNIIDYKNLSTFRFDYNSVSLNSTSFLLFDDIKINQYVEYPRVKSMEFVNGVNRSTSTADVPTQTNQLDLTFNSAFDGANADMSKLKLYMIKNNTNYELDYTSVYDAVAKKFTLTLPNSPLRRYTDYKCTIASGFGNGAGALTSAKEITFKTKKEAFWLENISYTNTSNSSVSSLTQVKGNTLKSKMSFSNSGTTPVSAVAVMGLFNNGTLEKVEYAPVDVPANAALPVDVALQMDMPTDTTDYEVKICIWNGLLDFYPYEFGGSLK